MGGLRSGTPLRRLRPLWVLLGLLALHPAAALAAAAPLPWEVWRDLSLLPRLLPGSQVLLRSSHCPSGCRFDRTSEGDTRFLRIEDGEAVIFDEPGAGAVVRIWMTMGPGVSEPLDPSIRLRIRLDGEAAPRVDLALPDLFRGDVPPFLAPLVADREGSSGGNVSYVPIPYRRGCRISLAPAEGAEAARIWYQVSFHRLAQPGAVATFTGAEDFSTWSALLAAPGRDPWPAAGGRRTSGTVRLAPRETRILWSREGPGTVRTIRLRAERRAWPKAWIRLRLDGETRVDMPLADFFAAGRGGATPTRSLLLGLDEEGFLYSHFPMPFSRRAEVALRYPVVPAARPVDLGFEVAWSEAPPAAGSGLFGAVRRIAERTVPGAGDLPLLDLAGHGKWVGLWTELSSVETLSREYLEGDERVYLDGSRHPGLYGTGVEDLFNGGFYFDVGPFRLALHGSPYHLTTPAGEDVTAAYRLLLADAVPFRSSLRAGLETGPTGNLPLRARTVAYYYSRPDPALARFDRLDLASAASRAAHAYRPPPAAACGELAARFEGEPSPVIRGSGCAFAAGSSRFVLRRPWPGRGLRLRRLLDAGVAGQEADVFVGGVRVGTFPYVDANPDRRWREVDLDLPRPAGGAALALEITVVPRSRPDGEPAPFTEYAYELWGPPER